MIIILIKKNVKVILSGKNLGYGAGNNLGLKNTKTRYVLISNPDVEYNEDFFDKFDYYLVEKTEFAPEPPTALAVWVPPAPTVIPEIVPVTEKIEWAL